jgi:hypothetical protein
MWKRQWNEREWAYHFTKLSYAPPKNVLLEDGTPVRLIANYWDSQDECQETEYILSYRSHGIQKRNDGKSRLVYPDGRYFEGDGCNSTLEVYFWQE